MNPNQSEISLRKRLLMAACLLAGITSCDNFKAADPLVTRYAEVKDPSRDTIFTISNEKMSTLAVITFEETLSDTAIVGFSSDTSFTNQSRFLLPMKNSPGMSISGLTGNSLFIKYEPYNKPISGNVKIGVTFQ
jgi:hypothetical protein